jgi:hypothetical protein
MVKNEMKISVIKINGLLQPVGESSIDDLSHMKNGREYICNITMHRNVKFHRLAFVLFKTIFDSQEFFEDFDVFRKYLIMKAGRVITVDTPKGVMFLPESIAFEKMSQDSFEKLFQAVITFAVSEYGQDKNVLNQIIEFA